MKCRRQPGWCKNPSRLTARKPGCFKLLLDEAATWHWGKLTWNLCRLYAKIRGRQLSRQGETTLVKPGNTKEHLICTADSQGGALVNLLQFRNMIYKISINKNIFLVFSVVSVWPKYWNAAEKAVTFSFTVYLRLLRRRHTPIITQLISWVQLSR